MMKKIENAEKVADEIAGVGEENPASKKRSCIKCKIELASDNKLPFCSACWEEITGYVKTAGIALGTLMVALIRKYGPKVGKAAFMTLKAILKK